VKIYPVNPEIIGLKDTIKNEKNKLTQAKHIARRASIPGELNKHKMYKNVG